MYIFELYNVGSSKVGSFGYGDSFIDFCIICAITDETYLEVGESVHFLNVVY